MVPTNVWNAERTSCCTRSRTIVSKLLRRGIESSSPAAEACWPSRGSSTLLVGPTLAASSIIFCLHDRDRQPGQERHVEFSVPVVAGDDDHQQVSVLPSRLPAVHHARGPFPRVRTLTIGEWYQLAEDTFTRAVPAPPKLRVQKDGG